MTDKDLESAFFPSDIDLKNQKHIENITKIFDELITAYDKDCREAVRESLDDSSKNRFGAPTLKQFRALEASMNLQHIESLVILRNSFSILIALNKDLLRKTSILQKELNRINDKTGGDLSDLKGKVEKITETPAVQALSKILTDNEEAIKKINERRQKLIKDSVV